MSGRWGYVIPIEERYWNRFCRLNKSGKTVHAYVQVGAALSADIKVVFFYSVHPFKEILGFAEVLDKIENDSRELWDTRGQETCFSSYDEYAKLIRRKEKVTFIRFRNLLEASNPVSFSQISGLLKTERMSQIGMYLDKEQVERLIELLK